MTKFAKQVPITGVQGPIGTVTHEAVSTHEGGIGWARDAKSELFLLAAANMVDDTFYESAEQRDARYVRLIEEVTKADPEWIVGATDPAERAMGKVGLIDYLRNKLQMRSASIMLACEYIKAGGPNGRFALASAIQRADEPAEVLGYWLSVHGRNIPAPVKRGVADATRRLYTERNALRYDGLSRAIRMADVIELVHPQPKDTDQSALFRYLLDKRHHADTSRVPPLLGTLFLDEELRGLPEDQRRDALRNGRTAEAGWSWERLSGWLPGGMDAEAWEHVIPKMGYMALIRNLRNFDEVGISDDVRKVVLEKIQDEDEVAKSRQFPYRFWSAYKNAPSLEWGSALEKALDMSVKNIPNLPGRTLVLIDTSGSMGAPVSQRSKVQLYEVGALFAAATAKRSEKVDVVLFADTHAAHPVGKSTSLLRYVESVHNNIGKVGYGTNIHGSIQAAYNGQDRVVVFTDEQARDSYMKLPIPTMHIYNLAGYKTATVPAGPGRFTYGGFTDAAFVMMGMLEAGQACDWPFA